MYKVQIGNEIFYAVDGERLSDVLQKNGKTAEHLCGGNGACGKCMVSVNGKNELSCRYRVRSDISVILPEMSDIRSFTGTVNTEKNTENMAFALDIGTSTLALALVSKDNKAVVRTVTRTNPQRAFGADVMTRIYYCCKNSVDGIRTPLISTINEMTEEFVAGKLLPLYVAGNTTMLHIFFGVNPQGMAAAPYMPVFLDSRISDGEALGLNGIAEVMSLPSISAFVGADITSGLNYAGFPEKNRYNLLVDLGTNAEIVLYSDEKTICTSAAAGPCFEGANISCGMSAVDGAVSKFGFVDSVPHIDTVGKAEIKGICGTGLIDMIACLVSDGTIDKSGYMENEKYILTESVYLTQRDVRQFQLAKSAVKSAIITLMRINDISFEQIDKMYISGGFSSQINLRNAGITGLLPEELLSRCTAVNNSSLLGTVKYICENNELSPYLKNAEYMDLSSNSVFAEEFIENMNF